MVKEKDLEKVILYYKDGTKITLEGKDLKVWIGTLESAMTLASVHGFSIPEYEKLWRKINKHLKTNKTYP